VGKLLYDAMRRGHDDSCGEISSSHSIPSGVGVSNAACGSTSSDADAPWASPRPSPPLMLSSVPFSHSLSPFSKLASAREVVVERRWSWSSVTERDELVGRMSEVSRLPQYLAMSG
jgi:hypothetical protein